MKKFLMFFSVFFISFLHGAENGKKEIFILHSYSQEYVWTKSQHDSFVEGLQQFYPDSLDVKTEYLDSKRVQYDESYQKFFLDYLSAKYEHYTPDVIYVTDDNALKLVMAGQGRLFGGAAAVFSGINDVNLAKDAERRGYRGVYETKDFRTNIELIRHFSPQTRDIWIVGDHSGTYAAIEKEISTHMRDYPGYRFHVLSSGKINEVLDRLPNDPRTFVLLTTIGEWTDQNGETMSIRQSINALAKRRNLILCSMEDSYVLGGVGGGYVTSGANQGKAAADLAGRYLQNGSMDAIVSLTHSPNVYLFDQDALRHSRLILPEEIASNAVVIHAETTFYERHRESILSMLFVVSVIILVYVFISFFVFGEYRKRAKSLQEEIGELNSKLQTRQALVSIYEKNTGIGFWLWHTQSGLCEFSDGFTELLGIRSLDRCDLESILERVHPEDMALVTETIASVSNALMPSAINHTVLFDDGTERDVVHYIHPVGSHNSPEGLILVGMVQYDEA